MNELILIISLAIGMGFFHEGNHPTEYVLNLINGNETTIEIQKNDKYSCPKFCDIDHHHKTAKCSIGCKKEHSYYHVHNFITGHDDATLNGIKISNIEKLGFSKYVKK